MRLINNSLHPAGRDSIVHCDGKEEIDPYLDFIARFGLRFLGDDRLLRLTTAATRLQRAHDCLRELERDRDV